MKQLTKKEKNKLIQRKIESFSNLFTVGFDGDSYKYLLNRTVHFKNIDDIPRKYIKFYTVQKDDTWYLISYKIYDTHRLWWLIAKLNYVTDATVQPQPGTDLKTLDREYVKSILISMKA